MLPFALALLLTPAHATEIGEVRPGGLGVSVGEPLGVTGKLYLGGRLHAVQADLGLGWLGPDRGSVRLGAAWLVHPLTPVDGPRYELPLHAGLGAFAGGWSEPPDEEWTFKARYAGLRPLIGADLDLADVPAQVSLDLALELMLTPKVAADLSVALAGRWYF